MDRVLYFMGLNLSTRQIAQELNLNQADAQHMAEVLRTGIVEKKPEVQLSGDVECDEVYVVAGHKGRPEAVKKRKAGTAQLAERSTLEKEKPPVFWMIQRGGEVAIKMLANV